MVEPTWEGKYDEHGKPAAPRIPISPGRPSHGGGSVAVDSIHLCKQRRWDIIRTGSIHFTCCTLNA